MNKKGFTMSEMLAVIIIMSILAIIIYPSYLAVSNSIKANNLKNKTDIIAINMLNFANENLIDDIKPSGECNGKSCCKRYDLYNYIIKYGIYSTDNTSSDKVINPIDGSKLIGCVEVSYDINDFKLKSEFINNCQLDSEVEVCKGD